eukprot:SAG22_NODE_62_length_23371_cov_84.500602_33_plen_74_part_00
MVSAMAPHCRTEHGTTYSLGGEDNLPRRHQGDTTELLYHDGMASILGRPPVRYEVRETRFFAGSPFIWSNAFL